MISLNHSKPASIPVALDQLEGEPMLVEIVNHSPDAGRVYAHSLEGSPVQQPTFCWLKKRPGLGTGALERHSRTHRRRRPVLEGSIARHWVANARVDKFLLQSSLLQLIVEVGVVLFDLFHGAQEQGLLRLEIFKRRL